MKKLLIFFFLFSALQSQAQIDKIKIGDSMPAFTFTNENGEVIDSKTLKNKVVLINFFATWCGPCLAELPFLQQSVWEKYKDNQNFVLLVIGRGHTLQEVKAFKIKKKFTFAFHPDKDKQIYNLFATQYIPRNYLINQNGKVIYTSMGFEENEFEAMLSKIKSIIK